MQNLPFHAPVVDTVAKVQEFVLDNLTKTVEVVGEQLPSLPIGPAEDFVATGAEYVDGSFALVEDLLGRNRTFVADLFGVAKGLVLSMAESEVVAMPAKKTAKAA